MTVKKWFIYYDHTDDPETDPRYVASIDLIVGPDNQLYHPYAVFPGKPVARGWYYDSEADAQRSLDTTPWKSQPNE